MFQTSARAGLIYSIVFKDKEGSELVKIAGKMAHNEDLVWDEFVMETEEHEWIGVKYAESQGLMKTVALMTSRVERIVVQL